MRILQTPPRFYPYIGGVENSVHSLSKELIKLGHQVKVICANEPPFGDKIIEGIEVKRLKYIGKIANTNITLGLPRAIINADFDIVHSYIPTPWSVDWSAIISLIKAKPFIVTYYNNIVGRGIYSYLAQEYNFIILPILLRFAKKIIITHKRYIDYSPYLKDCLKKIAIIPVGVDLEQFNKNNQIHKQEKTIFFLGLLDEFHRYKGLDYLIRAMDLVRKEIPEVKLIVGGEGRLKEEYRKLAHSLGLSEQIDFAGFIPEEKLAEYYNNCDVFVLPSISFEQEGFGIVLLEAMACGKPVVTTNITGLADKIQQRKAGIVVRPKDVNALGRAIVDILKDKDCALKMGTQARRLVEEEYAWNKIAKRIENLYLEILR